MKNIILEKAKGFIYQDLSRTNHDYIGYQWFWKFDNGYGASVVCNRFSRGYTKNLFELAVFDNRGYLCYTTEITNGTIGSLEVSDVNKLLTRIKGLK